MTEQRLDEDLRERFSELRADTVGSGRGPAFDAMFAEAKRATRFSGWRLGGLVSTALAAGLAAVMITAPSGPDAEAEFEQLVAAYSAGPAGASWQSPTSALLTLPGSELMRGLPSIGASVRGLDPSTRPVGPDGSGELR